MGSHKAVTRADAHAPGEVADYLDFTEVAAPATPAAGFVRVYPKADGLMYSKDDAGTETALGSAGGSGAMTQIAQTVVSTAVATITFASIAGTSETLRLVVMGRGDDAAAVVGMNIRFNSDSGTNYDWQRHFGTNGATTSASESLAATSARGGGFASAGAAAGDASIAEFLIPGYARTTFNKRMQTVSGYPSAASSADYAIETATSRWKSTAAITQIDLTLSAGNFITGTVATLYGIT